MNVHNLKMMFFITTIIILLNSIVIAYPSDPDNAALLYYQAFLLCGQPDTATETILRDVLDGSVEPNDKVIECVDKNKQTIRLAIEASKISYCDWGLKYSDGLSMEMPYLGHTRLLTYLMICEARILARNGDFRTALDLCLAVQRMARQHGESTDVGYLMGNSISKRSSACIQDILSKMPANFEIIDWLEKELCYIDAMPFSLPKILEDSSAIFRTYINKKKANELFSTELPDKTFQSLARARISNGNDEFFKQNAAYWDSYVGNVRSAMALAYMQAYPKLQGLVKDNSETDKPQATFARLLMPGYDKIYDIGVASQTQFNAVRAAIEIYKIQNIRCKLPDELPADLPKDLFSDKPFVYEKTSDGFVLRCQGKDLSKDETYEYKFKVK
ncbi:MAG: hypothetical protein ABFD79_02610 [Phycisphaerales bacterium]